MQDLEDHIAQIYSDDLEANMNVTLATTKQVNASEPGHEKYATSKHMQCSNVEPLPPDGE